MDLGARVAQGELARSVTGFVHGEEVAHAAETVSGILFGRAEIDKITEKEREMLMKDAPNVSVAVGDGLVDVLVRSGLAPSKREAREFIKKEAISVNGAVVTDLGYILAKSDFTHKIAFLKRGKRHMSVLVLGQ